MGGGPRDAGRPRPGPSERLGHLRTLVDLYGGPLQDNVSAFLTAIRIFELEPHDTAIRERLLAMATEVDGTKDLLDAVRRVLKRVEETGFRRELLAYQAEIDEKRPDGGADAERVYQEILALDPLHFGAYRALTRLYRDAERWVDLRKLLEVRQENLPEAKERLTLLWQIAEIDEALLEDRHARHRGAAEDHRGRSARISRPTASLEKHYAATERWNELDALLERAAARWSPKHDAVDADLAPGRAGPRAPGRRPRAPSTCWRRWSRRGPSDAGARKLLETILPLPEHRQRTAAILEPLYEGSGDWAKLVGRARGPARGARGPGRHRAARPHRRARRRPRLRRRRGVAGDLAARAGHRAGLARGAGRGRAAGRPGWAARRS